MNIPKCFVAGFILLSIAGNTENEMTWPDLPESGFIAGRAATKDDVASGQAVFSMDGQSLGPVDIDIPQYAMWTDENGVEHPVIVTQAERAPNDMQIIGFKTLGGRYTAAMMPEVRLLGSKKPD
jgi:hypothetical protein